MSQKTILPPEGPAGPGSELPQENSLLLPNAHDACDSPCESPAPEEATESPDPREQTPEGRGHVAGGNSTNGDLIRTQPQRLPRPATSAQEPGEGEAGQLQNGPHTGLSNGGGIHHGVTHARAEPRKHPSPVSHKMQRKLQSSLSVHSDSSRRSKGSSSSSHKPGSSPEERCASLVLACLLCRGAELSLGLLEACSSCLHVACSACCDGCARCWAALQETPAEDLHCHVHCGSDLFDPCCEPAECLEICLECCELCHNS
ncbi:hypothetical protein MATL_G00248190 [Megalops atlanticus]|uniref:MyoD family inhibitor domain containing n=1 Tax=Megalops atlanticus TaxID=7932 RepID=A0A9D3PCN4_MEGAT|nr:hypothetical protein MATL_G00248190 [Megalops atlanticus]